MSLTISRDLLARIWEEAERAYPLECCGILLGDRASSAVESILPARNIAAVPERQFEIDPVVLLAVHRAARDGGPDVIGHYHSHPTGPATPSATDARMAEGRGEVWLIVGRGGRAGAWQTAAWQAIAASEAGVGFHPLVLISGSG